MYLSLYANARGEILEHPSVCMLGRSGMDWVVPENIEMIPLPMGASLVSIPGYLPVGIDQEDQLHCYKSGPKKNDHGISAVAALLPQGFTRTLIPASVATPECGPIPLMGYAAVGLKGEQIYVAAVQSDEHRKWHPRYYNTEGLPAKISKMLKKYPDNRIYRQTARCSLEYGCYTAQNLFYGRWEGGIPTFNGCNANCIGCISESHLEVESPQNRLEINPSVKEIVEVGMEHLQNAKDGIISFGQGCEGEPSLNADKLAPAIEKIRQTTDQGTINMNTNAGFTEGIKKVCDAGMNAMRVTLFSPQEDCYHYYHKPKNYRLDDVKASIRYAKDKGLRVSLNLLVFPGFTDREDQIESLLSLIEETHLDMIQMRNLNIDPDVLYAGLPAGGEAVGIVSFLDTLKKELPGVDIGSYTWPVR